MRGNPTRSLKRSARNAGRRLKVHARIVADDPRHPLNVAAARWLERKGLR